MTKEGQSRSDSKFEYWDPVTDTYKNKRTNENVPDEVEQKIGVTVG